MNFLFDIEPSHHVEGLSYYPDFIDADMGADFLGKIDEQPWRNDLKRRVQHYGYAYDYRARRVTEDSYLGALPEWLDAICGRLYNEGIFAQKPDQVIANEYSPGQGISAHVDCVPCFGDVIASLTLGSAAMMQFLNLQTGARFEEYLEPNGLVVLSGAARYEWSHSIPARKSDVVEGIRIPRERRVSLTFRSMILD